MSKPVRRLTKKLEQVDEQLVRRIMAFATDRTLTRIRDYLGRGRPLAGVPLQSVQAQWIDAYLAVAVWGDDDRKDEVRDLGSEFDLRGLEPPLGRVAPEAARFRERFWQEGRKRKPDMTVLDRLEQEVDDFRDRLITEDREAMRL